MKHFFMIKYTLYRIFQSNRSENALVLIDIDIAVLVMVSWARWADRGQALKRISRRENSRHIRSRLVNGQWTFSHGKFRRVKSC